MQPVKSTSSKITADQQFAFVTDSVSYNRSIAIWGTNGGTGGFREGPGAGEGGGSASWALPPSTTNIGHVSWAQNIRNTVAAWAPDPAGELTALLSWIWEGRRGEGHKKGEVKSRRERLKDGRMRKNKE